MSIIFTANVNLMIFSSINFVYMFLYLYLGHGLKNRLKLSVTAPYIL